MSETHEIAVRTRGLRREFGSLVAVDDLDTEIPAGGVIGFVGPNGSGKSTTIRMLLGLIAPTAGTAEVLGHPVTEPHTYADRVGALIENPAFVPTITARATWDEPRRAPEGVRTVIDNGRVVVEDGAYRGGLAGRVLRARASR